MSAENAQGRGEFQLYNNLLFHWFNKGSRRALSLLDPEIAKERADLANAEQHIADG